MRPTQPPRLSSLSFCLFPRMGIRLGRRPRIISLGEGSYARLFPAADFLNCARVPPLLCCALSLVAAIRVLSSAQHQAGEPSECLQGRGQGDGPC